MHTSRTRRRVWNPWLSEFAATALLLFVMVAMFRALFDPGGALARAVPSPEGRLAVDAAVSGATVAALVVSPLGRSSGGHLNPAVSLAFWLMRALPGRHAAAYAAAQLAGSAAGVAAARMLWGGQVIQPQVGYATIRAAQGMPWTVVFAAEAAATAAMLAAVTFVAARPAMAFSAPLVAGATLTALILILGRWTGGSFNPARQFGPELFSRDLAWVWVYLTAPLAGAAAFGAVRSRMRTAPPLPCALCEEVHRPAQEARRPSEARKVGSTAGQTAMACATAAVNTSQRDRTASRIREPDRPRNALNTIDPTPRERAR